jgi:hypothetical protein
MRTPRIVAGTLFVFNLLLVAGFVCESPEPCEGTVPAAAPAREALAGTSDAAPEPPEAPALQATPAPKRRRDSVHETIRRVAREEGLPPEVLLAMAHVESRADVEARGDGGRSIGAFQIRYRLHRLTPAQCRDVEFAARWTARRMKSWGAGLWYGVYKHNGSGRQARRYVARVRAAAGRFRAERPVRVASL